MLSIISIGEAEKWDGIVKSFKNYDAYYLSGYSKGFQLHGDGEPHLFYYDDGYMRAMNVVMKRDVSQDENFAGKVPENSYFDLTTPYGYGGFLLEGKITENSLKRLDKEYSSSCRDCGIISEFVRFQPVLRNSEALGNVYKITCLSKTISIALDSREQIWNNLTSRNRNMVRKAQRFGIEIYWGRNAELYKEFVQMYNVTMDKDNATDYYYFEDDFYNSILNDFKYNSFMFYAVYQGKKIAMSIILFANKQMHYHLSSSDREYQHLAPTNLLLYEAACWGSENGYKTFHLGGGLGSSEDGLFKFKSSFNRNSDNIFAIGRKIFDEEKYEELVDIRKSDSGTDTSSGFFPRYRAEFGEATEK